MATRRELIERRPSARPTTRRSFGSAIRDQLPSAAPPATQRPVVHQPPVRPAAPRDRPPQAVAARTLGKRREADDASASEESEESGEARGVAPQRRRTLLGEEERLEREQDDEYREGSDAPDARGADKRPRHAAAGTTEDVVLAATMQLVEEFIVEDVTREGAALLRFREELAATFAEERRAHAASAALRADSVRLSRERRRARGEVLQAKEERAGRQARIGLLARQAARLGAQAAQLEAQHGLVADLADAQLRADAAKPAPERALALNLAALLAAMQENAHSVSHVRALNATLAKCLERLDEL